MTSVAQPEPSEQAGDEAVVEGGSGPGRTNRPPTGTGGRFSFYAWLAVLLCLVLGIVGMTLWAVGTVAPSRYGVDWWVAVAWTLAGAVVAGFLVWLPLRLSRPWTDHSFHS